MKTIKSVFFNGMNIASLTSEYCDNVEEELAGITVSEINQDVEEILKHFNQLNVQLKDKMYMEKAEGIFKCIPMRMEEFYERFDKECMNVPIFKYYDVFQMFQRISCASNEDIVAIMQDYEVTSNLYFCLIDRSSDKVLYSTNESIRDSVDFTHVNDDKYDEEADPVTVEGYNSNHWLALYRSILTDEHCYNTIIWTCYEAEFNNTIWGILPILLLTILVSCVLSAILAFHSLTTS